MSMTSQRPLATRFARNTFVLRSETPLAEDRMRQVAPSIFAAGKHASRSDRYSYIPTIDVLRGLRQEGFEPFMVVEFHAILTRYFHPILTHPYSSPGGSRCG